VSVATEEDQKWGHVINGVRSSSPPHHATSGMVGAGMLWTPSAVSPSTPLSSPTPGPDSDCPLNLTVSRRTPKISSPRTASPGLSDSRQPTDNAAEVGLSPPPAHNPDNEAARKSATLNHEVACFTRRDN